MTAQNGGYQEPSGIYYSETEPMRFLRLINFANSLSASEYALLGYSGLTQFNTDNILSQSAYRFKYYHYDEWQSKLSSLSGTANVASGILDWMRTEEPVYWYYYDLGDSGNFTRRIIKNASFPFDDISTIPANDIPLNTTIPLIMSSGKRLIDSSAILLPFYQSAGLIKQIQNSFETMFDNQIINSIHPTDSTISGVPVPQIGKTTALQLNNLNLKPSGFISEYATPLSNISGIIFPLNIVPGSGFQPILDMAQQINYPKEYIKNISAIVPWKGGSQSEPLTDCTHFGETTTSLPIMDVYKSRLHFGFMQSGNFDIEFNTTFPTYTGHGKEIDRFGNTRQTINTIYYPTLTVNLVAYSSNDGLYTLSTVTETTLSSFTSINTSGIYNISISSSGHTLNVNGTTSDFLTLLPGTNSFSRYYDPLGDVNSDNSESPKNPTINYYLDIQTGWQFTYSGGAACLGYSNLYFNNIPDLLLDPSNIVLSINNINIPTTKYNNATIGPRTLAATNSFSQKCFPIQDGSTITVNYKMPAINCHGYNYWVDRPWNNAGATSPECLYWNGHTFTTICQVDNDYHALRTGFCCNNVCTNIQDPGAALFGGNCNKAGTYSDCFVGFVPQLATFEIKNSCGDRVALMAFGGSLPPSGSYNTWVNVSNSATFSVAGFLNSWQNLTGYLTVTTEKECITLCLTGGSFGLNGCFKDIPTGQIIETHDSPIPLCFNVSPAKDSNDLAINYMVNNTSDCYGNGAINSYGQNVQANNCGGVSTCQKVSNAIATNGGMTVTIDSVVCHFVIGCEDGSTSTIDFTLPGGSVNYPAITDFGCNGDLPSATGIWSMGRAPATCDVWW